LDWSRSAKAAASRGSPRPILPLRLPLVLLAATLDPFEERGLDHHREDTGRDGDRAVPVGIDRTRNPSPLEMGIRMLLDPHRERHALADVAAVGQDVADARRVPHRRTRTVGIGWSHSKGIEPSGDTTQTGSLVGLVEHPSQWLDRRWIRLVGSVDGHLDGLAVGVVRRRLVPQAEGWSGSTDRLARLGLRTKTTIRPLAGLEHLPACRAGPEACHHLPLWGVVERLDHKLADGAVAGELGLKPA